MVNADVRAHALLNEIYSEPKVGVEIGVYRGQLSWRLLAANKNLFLYMVDPWAEVGEDSSYRTTDDKIARLSQDEHDSVMANALDEVKPFKGRYEVLRMTSKDAAPRFTYESLDFVFIDGDHSQEGCALDIRIWWPKVKVGGVLSGHDYRDERNYGVIPAVDEFVSRSGRKLRLGGNYTWFVTK